VGDEGRFMLKVDEDEEGRRRGIFEGDEGASFGETGSIGDCISTRSA